MNPKEALKIATIAHGAVGQMRESGVPYIVHPIKVALLARTFARRYTYEVCTAGSVDPSHNSWRVEDLAVASYLHDVIEDTKVSLPMLYDLALAEAKSAGDIHRIRLQLDIVWKMTKPDAHGIAPEWYYQNISESVPALIVKAADRSANLDDAFKSLFDPVEKREVKRWANYYQDTYDCVLPMYKTLPGLRSEIEWRLERIRKALPRSRAERAAWVESARMKKIPWGEAA